MYEIVINHTGGVSIDDMHSYDETSHKFDTLDKVLDYLESQYPELEKKLIKDMDSQYTERKDGTSYVSGFIAKDSIKDSKSITYLVDWISIYYVTYRNSIVELTLLQKARMKTKKAKA